MSGMGGGSGASGFEPEMNCSNISFNTDVNSPQEAAFRGLKVKDKLNVLLEENKVVIVRQDTEDKLGSINWSGIARLIECLKAGNAYVAVIRSIQDGLIKIHVSAK